MENEIAKYVTATQHIGVPTNDIEATIAFYGGLGFSTVYRTVNKAKNEKVAFLRLRDLTLETYENGEACGKPGAVDHIALDVSDIGPVFEAAKARGYRLLDKEIQFLPFWENGVRYFTIEGPNGEKLEFNQKL